MPLGTTGLILERMNRVRVGLMALAAAGISVTVGTASGATAVDPLPSSFCSTVVAAGSGNPDYLIVSDLGLQNPNGVAPTMVQAIEFVLKQHGFRAGRYDVGYQSCDDSTAQSPQGDLAKCAANAKAYAADSTVIGVIGAWSSKCSAVEIPILGRAAAGPVMLLSPTNTNPGLTHVSSGSSPGEPRRYFPTGRRNFARLVAPDDFQGSAAALLVRKLALRRVFVLDDGEPYGLDVAGGFIRTARKVGVHLAGRASWDVSGTTFDGLATRVASAHPDGILLGGYACPGCAALVKSLRLRVPDARLIGPDGFLPVDALVKAVGTSANGMLLLEPGIPPGRFGPLGQKLERKFGRASAEAGGAPVAGQAVEAFLNALAHSDGSRSSVSSHLLTDEVHGGIMGDFSFDRNGDIAPSPVTVYLVRRGRQTIDRVVRVSAALR